MKGDTDKPYPGWIGWRRPRREPLLMGWAVVMGRCLVCGRAFGFNPHKVPSHGGEPICRTCIERVNARRRELGNPEWPIAPDAYEPIPEEAL